MTTGPHLSADVGGGRADTKSKRAKLVPPCS